ncbi:MAG TPA: glycine zipper 2TM domain-containing protein [Rhodocyclaceae bacterium]|jgi:outer membrane lipoprotein SlyB|nr:glycine zipper 2TM domain-containing protein [Rhodocyclaceae bacterium]
MNIRTLSMGLLLGLTVHTATAQNYDVSRRDADTRYAEDKRLCAEESTSSIRMQCLRDARAEYDKALSRVQSTGNNASRYDRDSCAECGRVTAVHAEDRAGEGSAVGTIAGGVAGAALGSQIGQGTGRDLAAIAGAVGGAFAGRAIEGRMKSEKIWKVTVRFDNGDEKTYHFDNDPGLAIGTPVRASGNSIQRR